MVSKWRRLKLALGLNLCVLVPKTALTVNEEEEEEEGELNRLRHSSAPFSHTGHGFSNSSKKRCSICLASLNRGRGHAIFTAECSHSFHFKCIALYAKHGNQKCPVCRAKWKEIPLENPKLDTPPGKAQVNNVNWPQNNPLVTLLHSLPPRLNTDLQIMPMFQAPEPAVFDDDESLERHPDLRSSPKDGTADNDAHRTVEIKTYTEVPEVKQFTSLDNFAVLVHLKGPASTATRNSSQNKADLQQILRTPRAHVDLVTVLDISGSMAGTKLALVKRAMGFVIQNLSPNDRLSVIAFSSTARRLFPLKRMSESGKQQALQAVNSLVANGGTNIAEGLIKGTAVMGDRREKNPVASIILLSDGKDTYTIGKSGGDQHQPSYQLLVPYSDEPFSVHSEISSGYKIPVHTFGFGADHDASSLHSISEFSGGTFSFIEDEGVIQDAFAQCIGGLLSVVVKNLQVTFECVHPEVHVGSLKAGSYPNRVMPGQRTGSIDVGDLYADEERNFLVSVNVPEELMNDETSLLRVTCIYTDPLSKIMVTRAGEEVRIKRPEVVQQESVSLEVDQQKNRIRAAQAMAEAQIAAENGDLADAVSILGNCRKALLESVSARSQDRLCLALDAELKEMQERMANQQVYKASGRAYILSGLSSHSWQRATARGDSTDGSSLVQAYQTASMAEMLSRSQTICLGSPITPGVQSKPELT